MKPIRSNENCFAWQTHAKNSFIWLLGLLYAVVQKITYKKEGKGHCVTESRFGAGLWCQLDWSQWETQHIYIAGLLVKKYLAKTKEHTSESRLITESPKWLTGLIMIVIKWGRSDWFTLTRLHLDPENNTNRIPFPTRTWGKEQRLVCSFIFWRRLFNKGQTR